MLSIGIFLCAASIVLWPCRHAAYRLHDMIPGAAIVVPARITPRPGSAVLALLGGLVGWSVLGPGGAVASSLLCVTCWRRWKKRRESRQRISAAKGITEALAALVAELHVGAHPAVAAQSAAADAEPLAARTMTAIAVTARLGGNVHQTLVRSSKEHPAVAGALNQVARAWTLADRHGVPLAEVLDAVREDLEQRVRFAHQVHARMAGPRMSATVLAVLPELGVLLGEAIDARPLQVLSTTFLGQTLLIVGSVLICAGVLWSAKLTEHAVTL